MYDTIGQLPGHEYVYVDTHFTHQHPQGFIPAVWFGLVSIYGRMWGCTVLLENGAVYRNLPPHALAVRADPEPVWTPQHAQTWDCYGGRFTVLRYAYLDGLSILARTLRGQYSGTYLFTMAPIGDGFSRTPEQAKEFSVVTLDNGRLTIQPTNHLLVDEGSFTCNTARQFPTDLRRQTGTYSCEGLCS